MPTARAAVLLEEPPTKKPRWSCAYVLLALAADGDAGRSMYAAGEQQSTTLQRRREKTDELSVSDDAQLSRYVRDRLPPGASTRNCRGTAA